MDSRFIFAIGGFAAGVVVGVSAAKAVSNYLAGKDEDDIEAYDDIVNNPFEYYKYKSTNNIAEKESLEEVVNKYLPKDDISDEVAVEPASWDGEPMEPQVIEKQDHAYSVIGKADYEAGSEYGKLTATYFSKDRILAGYNDDLDEQNGTERGEFIVEHILANPGKDEFHFRDFADSKDVYVMVSEQDFDEAYAEFVEREAANYVASAGEEE